MRVDFWSSTEYATFLPGLVRALGPLGWTARSRFVVTERDYREARSPLQRLLIRSKAYGWYPLRLAAAMRSRRRPDVAVVCTNTFYAPWVAERVGRSRGVPVVHWVFDLFPDVLVAAGVLKRGRGAEPMLHRWVRATFDRAAANVFLGDRLLHHAEERFGAIPRAVVIPVGCDATAFANPPPTFRPKAGPTRLLYCGNLGRMHDTATLLGAVQAGLPADLEIEVRGNGAGFAVLAQAPAGRGSAALKLGGSLPSGEWEQAMRAADAALVTMGEGTDGIVMPSKTYSAMAAGQAIVAVCPASSDLAATVRRHACGWCVRPGDVAGLQAVLQTLVREPGELLDRRRRAWQAAREHYDQRVLADRWVSVLNGARERRGAA